jgi:hypothetical protein
MRIASAKEAARPASKTHEGIGKIIMTIIVMRATAKNMVGFKNEENDVFSFI